MKKNKIPSKNICMVMALIKKINKNALSFSPNEIQQLSLKNDIILKPEELTYIWSNLEVN